MKKAQNWGISYRLDRRKRPSGLAVRIFPAFWEADRKTKRALLMKEVRGWLDELRRQAH